MKCERAFLTRKDREGNTQGMEFCHIHLSGTREIDVILRALEDYTERKNLRVEERVLAGNMYLTIQSCPIKDVNEQQK